MVLLSLSWERGVSNSCNVEVRLNNYFTLASWYHSVLGIRFLPLSLIFSSHFCSKSRLFKSDLSETRIPNPGIVILIICEVTWDSKCFFVKFNLINTASCGQGLGGGGGGGG